MPVEGSWWPGKYKLSSGHQKEPESEWSGPGHAHAHGMPDPLSHPSLAAQPRDYIITSYAKSL